jgi:hypothetical protein
MSKSYSSDYVFNQLCLSVKIYNAKKKKLCLEECSGVATEVIMLKYHVCQLVEFGQGFFLQATKSMMANGGNITSCTQT